jgi:Skp family chaperone for outer membrane proteins
MIENIGKIRQNRDTNFSVVKEQKRIIENEIQELRTKINNHLDKLQEDLMKKLTEAVKQVTEETRGISFSIIRFCSLTTLKLVSLFCLILPIFSIISLIQCSVSVNIVDVFTFQKFGVENVRKVFVQNALNTTVQ